MKCKSIRLSCKYSIIADRTAITLGNTYERLKRNCCHVVIAKIQKATAARRRVRTDEGI